MSEDQRSAFSSVKEEDKNKSASNSSKLDDKQKVNITYSNNVVMTKSPEENLTLGPDNTLISLCRDRPAEIGTGKEYTSAAPYICVPAPAMEFQTRLRKIKMELYLKLIEILI